MAQGSPRPRRLTVFAEIAAVLALVIAIVGVVVAVLAYEHDKEVAASEAVSTPVVTVTQFTTDERENGSQPPDNESLLGDLAILLVVGVVAAFLIYKIWVDWLPSFSAVIFLSIAILAIDAAVAWIIGGSPSWALYSGGALLSVSIIAICRKFGRY